MSYTMETQTGLLLVKARIWHRGTTYDLVLSLNTGTSQTIIIPAYLDSLGIAEAERKPLKVMLASYSESATETRINRLEALGFTAMHFPIACKPLPNYLIQHCDGILGLDFFKAVKKRLSLDFMSSQITLS